MYPILVFGAVTPTFAAPAADIPSVVANAPALSAARLRIDAATARLGAAGRIPDPEVEVMYSRKQTPLETMPMYEISVRQPLPKAGERAADRDRVQAGVAMARAQYGMMAGEMAADTAMAIAEAETATRRADAQARQVERIRPVLSAVEARIGTGQGRLSDHLALQTQIATMQLMIAQDRTMAEDALSTARGRLGMSRDSELPPFSAPKIEDVQAELAPVIQMAVARTSEAHAMGRMARASSKPMTAVGLKLGREEASMGNSDTVGIAFMMEIPWRSQGYANADEKAARAEASASVVEADSSRYQIAAALSRVQRAERLADLATRLANETQQRVDAEYDSLVRSAGAETMSSDSTVLMVIAIMEKSTNAELQLIEAEGSVKTARAELWRYMPTDSFLLQHN